MNPLQPNLQSLKDEILQFKKEFSCLKIESSLYPKNLTLGCLQCLSQSTNIENSVIELSEDPDETYERFQTHLANREHRLNVCSLISFKIHCMACNMDLILPNNYTGCQNTIIGHLESSKHVNVHRRLVGKTLNSLTNMLMESQSNVKDLNVKLDGIIGEFDIISKKLEIMKPKPATELAKEVEYPKNTLIVCKACKCAISYSKNDTVLYDVWTHLKNQQHRTSFMHSSNKNLFCCSCCCMISITNNFDLSFKNVEEHVSGWRHYNSRESKRFKYCSTNDDTTSVATSVSHEYECVGTSVEKKTVSDHCCKNRVIAEDTTIKCNACQCTVSCSNDNGVQLDNAWAHLKDQQHERNLGARDKSFWCQICCTKIFILTDFHLAYQKVKSHINGSKHSGWNNEASGEEDENFGCSKTYAFISQQDRIPLNYEHVCESNNHSNKTLIVDASSVICNACKCTVSCSIKNSALLDNVLSHLRSERHNDNIIVTRNKSLWCCICWSLVAISEDLQLSFQNMKTHVHGRQHTGMNRGEYDEEEDVLMI